MYISGTTALKEPEYFTFEQFKESYDIGSNTQYLKIHSAFDKGRTENKKRPLEVALTFPYIQPNSDFNISWFVFDIDREFDYLEEIYNKNLLIPNFIIYTRKNGHVQIWYKLKDPVYRQSTFKKSKVYDYYKKLNKSYSFLLSADSHFNGGLCKNPFYYKDNNYNNEWYRLDFSNYEYSLEDFYNNLIKFYDDKTLQKIYETSTEKKHSFKIVSTGYSNQLNFNFPDDSIIDNYTGVSLGFRNDTLFNYVRIHCYKYYSKNNCSKEQLFNWCLSLLKELDSKNTQNETERKRQKELETIAESISSWTYENIQPQQKKELYTDSQRLKSLYKRRKNKEQHKTEVKKLLKNNPELSNREISRILTEKYKKETCNSGFSTATINKYIKELKKEKAQKHSLNEKFNELKNTNHLTSENFVNQFVEPIGDFIKNKFLESVKDSKLY